MELATPVLSISPLIMLLDNMWKLLPEVIFCTVAIFSGLIAWLLPETNNARLPETIEDIEEMRYKKKKKKKNSKNFFLETSAYNPDIKPLLLLCLFFLYSFLNSHF